MSEPSDHAGEGFAPFRYTTADGIRLSGHDYGGRDLPGVPVLCLAGLTRNARDFHALALRLSRDAARPRRVVALSMRGRGDSDPSPDPGGYDIAVEARDALDGMVASGLEEAAVIGTSRGAILTMAMAAMRPGVLHAVVMNDLGPVIEADGLMRIRAYLDRLDGFASWEEATRALEAAQRSSFPDLDAAGWERFARAVYTERDGRVVMDHDPAIHRTLDAVAEGASPPPMWAAFDALRRVPVLSIRGDLSKLFAAETQEAMAARHPRLETLTVPRQGHAPLLEDEPAMDAIADFLARHDPR